MSDRLRLLVCVESGHNVMVNVVMLGMTDAINNDHEGLCT